MIDINELLDDLHSEIKSYTGITQLVLGTQDIPPDLMEYPRMRMAFTIRYNPQSRQSLIRVKNVVDNTDNPDFDKDIEYTYIMQPEATLSINVYGDNNSVDVYLGKAREWFLIEQKGKRFLTNLSSNKCVIKNITDTQDRHTFIETDYEDRQGFDVMLGFSDEIKVIEKTIETVEINGKNYDL